MLFEEDFSQIEEWYNEEFETKNMTFHSNSGVVSVGGNDDGYANYTTEDVTSFYEVNFTLYLRLTGENIRQYRHAGVRLKTVDENEHFFSFGKASKYDYARYYINQPGESDNWFPFSYVQGAWMWLKVAIYLVENRRFLGLSYSLESSETIPIEWNTDANLNRVVPISTITSLSLFVAHPKDKLADYRSSWSFDYLSIYEGVDVIMDNYNVGQSVDDPKPGKEGNNIGYVVNELESFYFDFNVNSRDLYSFSLTTTKDKNYQLNVYREFEESRVSVTNFSGNSHSGVRGSITNITGIILLEVIASEGYGNFILLITTLASTEDSLSEIRLLSISHPDFIVAFLLYMLIMVKINQKRKIRLVM